MQRMTEKWRRTENDSVFCKVKVKLSLCLAKHHAMKTLLVVQSKIFVFLNLALR
jgi:hypothetical protein